jgi:hypothetical protein
VATALTVRRSLIRANGNRNTADFREYETTIGRRWDGGSATGGFTKAKSFVVALKAASASYVH